MSSSPIDIRALTGAIASALPGSEPFAAIPMFVDQVRWLEPDAGLDLLERLVTRAHPSAWQFDDVVLDAWPPAVAARALEAVRALPPGEDRVEALCRVARRLTPQEQEEALAGILDGTYRQLAWGPHTKPMSRRDLIVGFVRTLPAERREAWISREAVMFPDHPVLHELGARKAAGSLTETALRGLWARLPHHSEKNIPREILGFASYLPSDLRRIALQQIRACPDQRTRLWHLANLDEELTDSEREEVVELWPIEHLRDDPRTLAQFHLPRVARHLPKVAPAVRRRWLDRVLAFEDTCSRQVGLLALLPSLTGPMREDAAAGVLAALEEDGCFYGKPRWDLLGDDALSRFVLRLRDDPYGWHRDELVEHIWMHRSPSMTDALFELLLDRLDERPGDTRLEIARSLTPWLADRTAGAAPHAIAQLPVPGSECAPDALYTIGRVIRGSRTE